MSCNTNTSARQRQTTQPPVRYQHPATRSTVRLLPLETRMTAHACAAFSVCCLLPAAWRMNVWSHLIFHPIFQLFYLDLPWLCTISWLLTNPASTDENWDGNWWLQHDLFGYVVTWSSSIHRGWSSGLSRCFVLRYSTPEIRGKLRPTFGWYYQTFCTKRLKATQLGLWQESIPIKTHMFLRIKNTYLIEWYSVKREITWYFKLKT